MAVDAWLDWEEVRRREQQKQGALVRRVRGKRGAGAGRCRRRQRRRRWLLAKQREQEQVRREVQQRLDFVRWEERQEHKWEAAAAATVVAAAAAAAGVRARWWVRKQQAAAAGAAKPAAATAAARAVTAPAGLCRRAERVPHSRPRHGGRGRRLGGGGKRGWVT